MPKLTDLYNLIKEVRVVAVIFLLLLVAVTLFLYRSSIIEIFDYRKLYNGIWQDITQSSEVEELSANAVIVPIPEVDLVPQTSAGGAVDDSAEGQNGGINNLEIPRLGVSAPILFAQNTSNADIQKLLKRGVVVFPMTSGFDEDGVNIILGHSAPSGWPKINYDWIFSDLNSLQAGDAVKVFYGGKEYKYAVTKKFFVNKGEDMVVSKKTSASSVLLLITCWPPGVDNKRIIVQAESVP